MALAAPRVRGSPQDQSNRSAVVTVVGYFYNVEFANDGSKNHDPVHRVGKDRRCTCPLGDRCQGVTAVTAYLKSGGERAQDPPPGFYPVAPSICPICRAPAIYDSRLSSVRRGAGWRCTQAGGLHYWEAHVQVLRQKLAANPWLFPPVVVREGVRLLAYAGVQPGDSVLYPGVLREEVITEDDHL